MTHWDREMMKLRDFLVAGIGLCGLFAFHCFGQGMAFTYQGRLNDGGQAASGVYDLSFSLYATNIGENVVAGPITNSATVIINGLFVATLDFGGIFGGSNYWLGIGVRTNGSDTFTPLSPRHPILPVPYAIMAGNASNLLGTLPAAQLTGTLAPIQLPANVVTNGESSLNLAGTFRGNGAGLTSLNASQITGGTVDDARLSASVVKNPDAYTVAWATNTSPYPATNVSIVNAVASLTNGPIHWLTTRKTNALAFGFLPAVAAYGNPRETLINGFEFGLNGDQVTLFMPAYGTAFNIQVNGGNPQAYRTDNSGNGIYFTMKFNTYARRLIRLEGMGIWLVDLETYTTNSIIRQAVAKKRILIIGDSFADGANGVNPQDTFAASYLKFHPDVDVWLDAVGGSGYCNAVNTNDLFINRLAPWVFPNQFDAIIVTGGYNDGGTASNTLFAAASLYYQTLKSNYPNAFLGVVLPFNSQSPLSSGTTNAIYAIRAACLANSIPFIDPSGSQTNEAPGARPWINGYYNASGNAGGNAAAYISSDGVHPTLAGHLFLEANLDDWITANIFPALNSLVLFGNGSGLVFTNAAGAKFSLMVNAATNGLIFISQ